MADGWTVDDVADLVRRKVQGGKQCALLIGAGCSYQAGIPLASGFVDEIRTRFPREYARAAAPSYPACMGELDPSDRHELICKYIDTAKINWAHISIAQLMRAGYVDRVLTTNFDPLVVRACALLNLYPAVYDMAVVRNGFLAEFVRDRAVFHLHGQRDGFVQLHDKAQVDKLAESIEPLFEDTARNRSWIVVGYSGANDPVFQVLAERADFPNRLIWVGFRDEKPADDVRAALFESGKNARWVSGYDPDTFLLQLASRLGCFPPGFFARPFSHLLELFGLLAGFRLPGQDVDLDWAARARGWIEQAIATFEAVVSPAAGALSPAPAPPPPVAPPPMPAPAPAPEPEPEPAPPAAVPFPEPDRFAPSPERPVSAPIDLPLARDAGEDGGGGIELERGGFEAPAEPAVDASDGGGAAEPAAPPKPPHPTHGHPTHAKPPAPAVPEPPDAAEAAGDVVGAAWVAMMTGDYDGVLALQPVFERGEAPGLAEPLAGALAAVARTRKEKAQAAPEAQRPDLLREAQDLERQAEALRPGIAKGTA